MLETKAVFNRKENSIEAKSCVVDKVINLSGSEFDLFSRNLMRDWDFIRDNRIDTIIDKEGRYHCLLVVGDGRRDGILVNSEGGDYARYSAFIPNAEDFLTVGRYPALAELNRRLIAVADDIVRRVSAEPSGERVSVDIEDLEATHEIHLDNDILDTVLGMLDKAPGIDSLEIDKNELLLYHEPEVTTAAKEAPNAIDLTDPSVTQTDMYAYGYSYGAMIPLGKERALELFDEGYQIFQLEPIDVERVANSRSDIEAFTGMFGVVDQEKSKQARSDSIEVFVLNRERYENGKAIGEWLTLPADADAFRGLMQRIGIDRPSENAFSVTAVRLPFDCLSSYVTKHDSLDELNMLASHMKDTEDYELDKLQAIITSRVMYIGEGIAALINVLYEDNLDAFDVIDVKDAEALGRYYKEGKSYGISFEEYGRQIAREEEGAFTDWGYIYCRYKELLPEYVGVVPDEYRIVSQAILGLRTETPERLTEEKPSVLDKIRTAREAPVVSNEKPARQNKKDKGGAEH